MPYRPNKPCKHSGCINTVNSPTGYCTDHAFEYNPPKRAIDNRPSADARGYGKSWQIIRAQVLRSAGIPRELWSQYDVHHEPPYNPDIEPRHTAYTLIPMLKSEHSKLTASGAHRGRGCESLGLSTGDRGGSPGFHSCKME